ncbi:MAG: hypothetical protein OXB98_19465 [Bryobacterales bacterium]|nr:hypothetical protein [Bryobacterales bacterium]
MMRRLLLLLLALGLWQIAYAQIHCALETADSDEACCELCHLSSLTPIDCSALRLFSPNPTFHSKDTLPRRTPLFTALRPSQPRAPPL